MLPTRQSCIILVIFVFFGASDLVDAYVGINIGTDSSDIPSASDVVSILQTQQIKHVRLFDSDHQMLKALANTGIEVIVGIPNDQVLSIGESKTEAANWINKNIVPFIASNNITYIAVGNEVLSSIPNAALVLVPAMQYLYSALLAADLNVQVKISSPQSMELIAKPFPPSTAAFNSTWNSVMHQFFQFLKNTASSFMLNAHPYYSYTKEGIFPLEYALLQALPPNKQIVDPNTLLHYSNMFDAMVDAAYYSMEALNFSDIPIIVTETGWPRLGGDDEPYATEENALVYNSNLIHHVLDSSGTPSRPNEVVSAYIYELFNEDLQPGSISQKNWGVVFPNGTKMYSLSFLSIADVNSNSSSGQAGVFCVANSSADATALKNGLDWACGPGGANCSAIQEGQPCYVANNLAALASYAYNDYYQRTQAIGGTCNFDNTAVLTTINPSYGSCTFAGSSGTGTSTGGGGTSTNSTGGGFVPSPSLGPAGFDNGVLRVELISFSYVVVPLLILFSCFEL